jgi:ubiquinone/menaquinone biosynthesis C-methylase UbiE
MSTSLVSDETPRAFDAAAASYDDAYETLEGIRRLRILTTRIFLRFFQPGQHLLELNCGTGTDAIILARRGMNILATDSSPLMLREAQRKVEGAHLGGNVQTQLLSFHELETLHGRTFDGVYSNLGGLNCTNNLKSLGRNLGMLTRPGGCFIATVMPSFCLWETVAFAARTHWKQALRRRNPAGCLANLHGGLVQTYYHSPRKFSAAMSEYFEPVELQGLNIFTPPPNSTRAYSTLAGWMRPLEQLDALIAGIPPFSWIGDHYVMVLRRRVT